MTSPATCSSASTQERDNEYLVPGRYLANYVRENARAALLRRYYRPVPSGRPFVYFPLHVTDDYKIKRVIPHCVDQAALIEQVADYSAPGPRPGDQGAPAVDRAQLDRA